MKSNHESKSNFLRYLVKMKIEKFPDQLNSIFIRVDYIKNIDKEDKKVLTDEKKG